MACNNCPYNSFGICRLSFISIEKCVICPKKK